MAPFFELTFVLWGNLNMAKKATPAKPTAATVAGTEAAAAANTNEAAAVAEERQALAQGLKPYTLLHGTHRQLGMDPNNPNAPPDERVYKAGDVVYSERDLSAVFPDRFVAGRAAKAENGVIRSTPGLGVKIEDEITTGGYDVYSKDGALYAYVPGQYGSPASPPLVDLVAAEEWCNDNALPGAE